jgi:hypothetical protein
MNNKERVRAKGYVLCFLRLKVRILKRTWFSRLYRGMVFHIKIDAKCYDGSSISEEGCSWLVGTGRRRPYGPGLTTQEVFYY